MSSLFPTRTIFSALGCLINDPMLLEESKIKLTREDFYAKDEPIFHVMIFAAINNLYNKGATKMQPADIDEYLSEFKDKYKVFTDNDGLQWCYQAVEYSNPENYSYYAEKIKKFSLLRQLHEDGISLAGIYDMNVDGVDEETQAQFDELTVDDIISKVQNKVHGIATAYQVGYDRASSKAGDNGLELLNQFKETPMYGHATQGELQNTIFRGALPKTSLLRSALTNTGKCIVGDSIIFTDKGMMEIQDVINHYDYNSETHELEAKVVSYEPDLKKQIRPTSHWYDMGEHDTIKVVTEHGYEVEGTPEHPMMINRFGKVMWCRLDEITEEDYLIVSLNNQMFGNRLDNPDYAVMMGTNSHMQIKVPEDIKQGTKDTVTAYLNGVFNTSNSCILQHEKTSKEIQIMLANIGVLSTRKKVEEGYKITIEDIGVEDTWNSRVKTITKSRNRVYDFTVPETHSFVANTLISHNTRMSIAEATDFAISKWYNYQTSQWEDRGEKLKVLFISTEMEEDELQPTMWSYVAGVKEEDIRDGKLSPDEEKAVRGAIEHLQECDLYIEYVPKFDPQTINAIIKEYAIQHQIDVVFFDYIHLSFEIMMEISSKTKGMTMREDMMLTIFAAGLEELAREYGFHLRTSTQMNGNSNSFDQSTQMLDQSLLRGAKAMADKMQYGIIMTRPTEKELGLIESIVTDTQRNFGGHPIMPNFVYHIYKNRKSKYKGKLWLYVDFDTMRQTELFMTDFNNNFIKVPKTDLLNITKD